MAEQKLDLGEAIRVRQVEPYDLLDLVHENKVEALGSVAAVWASCALLIGFP